jgi:hypothetical protein
MRALAAAVILVALGMAAAATARAAEQPDAALLLDLDLLRESDPRVERDASVARSVGLLEMLERLQRPAAARRGDEPRPAPKEDC